MGISRYIDRIIVRLYNESYVTICHMIHYRAFYFVKKERINEKFVVKFYKQHII